MPAVLSDLIAHDTTDPADDQLRAAREQKTREDEDQHTHHTTTPALVAGGPEPLRFVAVMIIPKALPLSEP